MALNMHKHTLRHTEANPGLPGKMADKT